MMKTYTNYKASGVEWLGDIPEHWKVNRTKFLSTINPSKTKEVSIFSDELVSFLPMEKVSNNGTVDYSIQKHIRNVNEGFTYFKKGDVVIAKITPCFENGKGALLDNMPTIHGFGTTEFHVVRCKKNLNSYFYYFISVSAPFRKIGEIHMTGSAGQQRIPTSYVSTYPIAIPPLSEQQTIANYLDKKTAQIARFIENKKKLIQLLEEEKKALITQAVTRGLDKSVRLKPSGVEWLGDIPEHWELLPGFLCFRQHLEKNNKLLEKTVLSLSYGNIVVKPEEKLHGLVPESFDTYQIVYPNEIIIRTTDLQNDVNSLRVGISKNKGIITSAYLKLQTLEKFNPYFIYFSLHAYDLMKIFYGLGSGLRQSLSFKDFKRLPFIFTTPQEQQAIVAHIEKQSQKIEEVISKYQKEIELIIEYRQRLIYDAVTGKIKLTEDA